VSEVPTPLVCDSGVSVSLSASVLSKFNLSAKFRGASDQIVHAGFYLEV